MNKVADTLVYSVKLSISVDQDRVYGVNKRPHPALLRHGLLTSSSNRKDAIAPIFPMTHNGHCVSLVRHSCKTKIVLDTGTH